MKTLSFDIHGIVSLVLESPPKDVADLFLGELDVFCVQGVKSPNFIISFSGIEFGEPVSFSIEGMVVRCPNGDKAFAADGIIWNFEILEGIQRIKCLDSVNPSLLWHIFEQLVKVRFLQQGYAFLHGAAFERSGNACAIVGLQRQGKTLLLMEALRRQYGYLADDFVIVNGNGTVLSYPPSRVKLEPYHLALATSRVATNVRNKNPVRYQLYRSAMYLPLRPLLGRAFPRLGSWLMPTPEGDSSYTELLTLFPSLKSPFKATLSRLVFLSSTSRDAPKIKPILSSEEALRKVLACTVPDFTIMQQLFRAYSYMSDPSEAAVHWIGGFEQRLSDVLRPLFQNLKDIKSVQLPTRISAADTRYILDEIASDL